jgi:hypothetical protein
MIGQCCTSWRADDDLTCIPSVLVKSLPYIIKIIGLQLTILIVKYGGTYGISVQATGSQPGMSKCACNRHSLECLIG